MAILYATHGLIGSGKTTFAKKFCRENKVLRLSHDEIMIEIYGTDIPQKQFYEYAGKIHKVIFALAEDMLKMDKDVFMDLALFTRKERDLWRNLAKKYNASFKLFHIDCPKEIALERTLKRTSELPKGVHKINKNAFNKINSRFETLENDEERIIIKS